MSGKPLTTDAKTEKAVKDIRRVLHEAQGVEKKDRSALAGH